ncbi:MAG: HYR domain-containing protein [Acidobacteria bacterium]|nr:HYR domain-containing protein [Acidobacteriota bacterium]
MKRSNQFLFAIVLFVTLSWNVGSNGSADVAAGSDAGLGPVSQDPVDMPNQGPTAPDPGFLSMDQETLDAPDVWVDSQANGFDTYVLGQGPSGTPKELGDPLVPGVVYRVYARVHNFGDAYPPILTLRFFVRQPIRFGGEEGWRLIGTLESFGPVVPHSFRDGYVEWTPASAEPVQIKVEIEPLMDETQLANNSVIDTSFFLDQPTRDERMAFTLTVRNSSRSPVNVSFEATVIPNNQEADTVQNVADAWQVTFTPASFRLRPNATEDVLAVVNPPPCSAIVGVRIRVVIRGLPLASGFSFRPRPYRGTQLTLNCPPGEEEGFNGVRLYHFTGTLAELTCPQNSLIPIPNKKIDLERDYNHLGRLPGLGTDLDGNFEIIVYDRFQGVPGERDESVKAIWIGDVDYPRAESPVCTFRTKCQPLAPSPFCTASVALFVNLDANCRVASLAPGEREFIEQGFFVENCVGGGVTITSTSPPLPGLPVNGQRTPITFTARDASGHTATCTMDVTLVPSFPKNIEIAADAQCQATITDLPGVPDCAEITKTIPPLPVTLSPGVYVIYAEFVDYGTYPFRITVVDTTPPELSCPGNLTLTADSTCQVSFNLTPTATDCNGPVTITSNPSLPATLPVGTHTVTYTATDKAGNTSTCPTMVTVVDQTPPTITCPANITESCGIAGGAVVGFTATTTDACDPNPTLTCTPASGSLFPVGTTTVTCTATDDSGNTASCSFMVTVMMNNPPTANAGSDQSYVVTSFPATLPLNGSGSDPDSGQTVTCQWVQTGGPTATINSPNSCGTTVSVPTVGGYTFQLTATDSCGVAVTDQVTIAVAEP